MTGSRTYHHGVLIGNVVTGVDDLDAFAPIHSEGSTEDVYGGPALVPLDRWFCLHCAVCLRNAETVLGDQLTCLGDELMS